MEYYVRPRHLYSHSRRCTRSSLCRRLSRLVASLIFYLLNRASVHEISALVTWFQLDISSDYGDLDLLYLQPLWRSWSYVYLHQGDSELCILYEAMTTYVISCNMPIHGHLLLCIEDCYMHLQLFAELYYCTMLIGWLVFHLGSSITPLLGWNYNVFRPSYDPFHLTY